MKFELLSWQGRPTIVNGFLELRVTVHAVESVYEE
jgi:hypothetical protein